MTIDPSADRPVYKQLADLIRARIQSGEYRPGQRLPAENDFVAEYGISRDSVRRAMAVLRGEGLIVTELRGSRVREVGEAVTVSISPGTQVAARMPTEPERKQLGIAEGVPILIITEPDGETRKLPADRTIIEASKEQQG
ncbi:GntR family transcriptional regulator [Thermobispora bispora]|uniref:Transcriptional regulator, GntR family n=1 Tax=Thermobispora bispora (strain ATCC 19993 / DSM 43833 / CBS 139.67 / JCM 10125 / KCTC 9307 / NBRC 14880 / R51) TaxID=469371 RepID=D6Y292_THEBD|nr:GntR family transcriptional regulator [Thermobispora bispora]ADG86827.1 transcriptional regulator, GntR family [Thermobispora bispora DSM 43833]